MTINSFAKYIGLSRAENLYQIKNGNNGISQKLARRIVESFPEVSIGWLLTGEGEMLHGECEVGTMPCYCGLDSFLAYCRGAEISPDCIVSFPMATDAEMVVVVDCGGNDSVSCVLEKRQSAKKSVFLKKIAVEAIIPSLYYMILTSNFVYLRKVTAVQDDNDCRTLLFGENEDLGFARCLNIVEDNGSVGPDTSILLSEIEAVYRVVGVYGAM